MSHSPVLAVAIISDRSHLSIRPDGGIAYDWLVKRPCSIKATAEKISVVQAEGPREVSRETKFYNLDAIISVGYRVQKMFISEAGYFL